MSRIIKKAPTNRKNFNVCIFCGSNMGRNEIFRSQAIALAEGLAVRDIGLVYGGASVGVMGLLADTMLAKGGRVLGVIPEALRDREVAHAGLTELRVVKTMHERKKLMFDLADSFLTFPGGFGTLDETFEIITWKQIGIHEKPLLFLDIDGYYKPLIQFIDTAVSAGFIRVEHRGLFGLVNTAEEALKAIEKQLPMR